MNPRKFFLLSPNDTGRLIAKHLRFVIALTCLGAILGLGKYYYANHTAKRLVYEAEFNLQRAGIEHLKLALQSEEFLSKIRKHSAPEFDTISDQDLSGMFELPSLLEGRSPNTYSARVIVGQNISEGTAKKLLAGFLEYLPETLNMIVGEQKPPAQILHIDHFFPNFAISPDDFLPSLVMMPSFRSCIHDETKIYFPWLTYAPYNSTQVAKTSPYRRMGILSLLEVNAISGPYRAAEIYTAFWDAFFSCYERISVPELNDYFSRAIVLGQLPSALSGPYSDSSGALFQYFFADEKLREKLSGIVGFNSQQLLVRSLNFRVHPDFRGREPWLITDIHLPNRQLTQKVAEFLKSALYQNSPQTIIREPVVFESKPALSRDLVMDMAKFIGSGVRYSVTKEPNYRSDAPPPFRLFATVLLYAGLGFFISIILAQLLPQKKS